MNVYLKIALSFMFLVYFFNCENTNYPEDIWDEDNNGSPNPFITSVVPEQGAFAGIDTLTINGGNFSTVSSENIVYFNESIGRIISSSSEVIEVVGPNLVSDSISIRIAVQGALEFGSYSNLYKLYPAIENYGPFDQFTDIFSLDLDREENLIVSLDGSPNAEFWMVDINQDSSVWSGSLSKGSGMKLGPDGSIYFVNYQRFLYKDEQGTEKENSEIFKRLNGNATDLDFYSFGNLYVGGNGSLIDVVDIQNNDGLSSGVTQVVDLDTLDIVAMRVFSDFLYILTNNASFDQAIYRMGILNSEGALGELEFVFDWSSYSNNQFSALCFTLDYQGNLYIGSDSEIYPITVVKNGSARTLYPSILSPPINYMSWGNSNYLYIINRMADVNRVQRINTRALGANYYGRP